MIHTTVLCVYDLQETANREASHYAAAFIGGLGLSLIKSKRVPGVLATPAPTPLPPLDSPTIGGGRQWLMVGGT